MKFLSIMLVIWAGLPLTVSRAAEGPVRFAIVGLVHDHARGFIPSAKSRHDIQLVAIVEPNRQLAQRYAQSYQLDTNIFYTRLEEMLDSRGAGRGAFTSTSDHAKVVETCAARGIHVMMEKPLAANMDTPAIESAAKKGGIQVVVNYETTWYPANHQAYACSREERGGRAKKDRGA
jgi:predicted dehydrogenase